MTRAIQVLWATIAVVFIASTILAGVTVWKVFPGSVDRLVTTIGYGVVMLASFIFIAFAMMVAFTC